MNEAERLAEVALWIRYAREDLVAAEAMVGHPDVAPRHACFLAQQAAEKALKAVLVFSQIDFAFRHDLDALRNLVPSGWQLKGNHPDLADLTDWAVESRYPAEQPEATETDARDAARQARAVVESIERDLRQHGFNLGEAR